MTLFSWNGTLSRGHYALIGFIGVAIKHNMDRLIAYYFHYSWTYFSFWSPLGQVQTLREIAGPDKQFLLVLFLTSLPFIGLGWFRQSSD